MDQIFLIFNAKKRSGDNECVYIYIYIYRQHFFVNANFIKHNRHFMSTYFLLDPFEFPYYFYRIRGELIYFFLQKTNVIYKFKCPL